MSDSSLSPSDGKREGYPEDAALIKDLDEITFLQICRAPSLNSHGSAR